MPAKHASPPGLPGARTRRPQRPGPLRSRRQPETLTGLLTRRAIRHPGDTHMIIPGLPGHPDTHITFSQVYHRAKAVAHQLELETDPGDRVMICGLAGLDLMAGLFGVMLARCVAVPAPPPLMPPLTERCADIVADCEPARVLITGGLQGLVADGLDVLFPDGDTPVGYISAFPDAPGDWAPSVLPGPEDTAYLQYSSGTTGGPEGSVITHRAACTGLRMTSAHIRLTPGTPSATWLPPWHDLGLTSLMLAMQGRSPVLVTQPHEWVADPVGWLADLSRRKIEVAPLPSFAFSAMSARLKRATADQLSALDLSHWRLALTGADLADPAGIAEFTGALSGYGLTASPARWLYGAAPAVGAVTGETPSDSSRTILADPGYLAAGRIVAGTVESGIRLQCSGRPLRRTRVRIRSLDGSGFAPQGEIGEIVMQGPQLASGSWRGTGPWTMIGEERWMAIGDLGALLEDGTLVVLGRTADVLTFSPGGRRGRRYYPSLIEQAAAEATAAVRSHKVVAVQDAEGGIVVAAEPRGRADLAAAADAIRGAVVRKYGLVLADVLFLPPGSIPVTTSGKTCRRTAADLFRAGELARSVAEDAA